MWQIKPAETTASVYGSIMLNDSAQVFIIPDKYHLLYFLQQGSPDTSLISSVKFPEVLETV
jgi:hypothetical protein